MVEGRQRAAGALGGLWVAAIAVATLVAYGNSFHGAMLFDDVRSIVENPRIRHFPAVVVGSSRPLTELSFYLNFRYGGLDPMGYHIVNTLIHLVNAWLLFGVVGTALRVLGFGTRRATLVGGLTALLWAVHPLNTESVSYIVQRAECLMAFFLLATLWAVLRSGMSSRPRAWWGFAVAACVCGMLTKPVMVAAPVVVLCVDASVGHESLGSAWSRRRPLYRMLFLTVSIPLLLVLLPNESSTSVGLESGLLSPFAYLLTQCRVIARYLRLAVLPWPLCLDYGWSAADWRAVLLPGTWLLALAGVTVMLYRKRSPCAAPGCWFFLLLAPSSSVIPLADVAAEHRMYLPLAALLLLAVLGLTHLLVEVPRRDTARQRAAMLFGGLVAALVMMGFVWGTRVRNVSYRSAETMWRSVLAVEPSNLRARMGVGAALLASGANDEAEPHLRFVVEHIPLEERTHRGPAATLYSLTVNNLGVVFVRQRRFADAERCFRDAVRVAEGNVQATVNLVALLRYRGANGEARSLLEAARAREPGCAEIRTLLENVREPEGAAPGGRDETTRLRASDP